MERDIILNQLSHKVTQLKATSHSALDKCPIVTKSVTANDNCSICNGSGSIIIRDCNNIIECKKCYGSGKAI